MNADGGADVDAIVDHDIRADLDVIGDSDALTYEQIGSKVGWAQHRQGRHLLIRRATPGSWESTGSAASFTT